MSELALRDLLARLTDDASLWVEHVRHDPDQRVFVEVAGDERFEAWLICWMPGHDTGFHDHDLSCGAVTVLSGELVEERLLLGGRPASRRYRAGETFEFDASDIHRCRHAGNVPTTTLHVYSPRLRRMGAYRFGAGGVLARHPLAYGEELRALTSHASPSSP
jgi:predicted metal-dependent enzyme (double-stranded beta helix superfamily)